MGLVNYKTYGNISLTEEGENLAIGVIKKQDILEMFLVDVLEIDKNQATEEAKAMKHAMSENTALKLDKYITEILNLGDLDCGYDANSEKCRKCVKVTAKNRLRKNNKD